MKITDIKDIPEELKEARSLSALDPSPLQSSMVAIARGERQKFYFYKDGSDYIYETDRIREWREERNRKKEEERRKRWAEREEALKKDRLLYG